MTLEAATSGPGEIMRSCPWCGRQNLNVYAYCQGCGRGFDDPQVSRMPGFWTENVGAWLTPEDEAASPWPVYTAVTALLFGILLTWHVASGVAIALPLAVAMGFAGVVLLLAWLGSGLAARKGFELPRPVMLRETTYVTESWSDRKMLGSLLTKVNGVRSVVVEGDEARSAIVVTHEAGTDMKRVADLVRGHAGPGIQVTEFEPRDLGETNAPKLRMGLTAASLMVGGLVIGGLVAAGSFAALRGDADVAAGPDLLPGEGVTTIVGKDIVFQQEVVRAAAGAEMTLTFDNQDVGIPHNIEFFNSTSPGEGGFLDGCTAGCVDGGTELRTDVQQGPVVQEFTFIAPAAGRYAYWCVIHPTTMTGSLIVE